MHQGSMGEVRAEIHYLYGVGELDCVGGLVAACGPRTASAVPMRPEEVARITNRARTAFGSGSGVYVMSRLRSSLPVGGTSAGALALITFATRCSSLPLRSKVETSIITSVCRGSVSVAVVQASPRASTCTRKEPGLAGDGWSVIGMPS